ncbi:MAG: hypothetical protein H7A33_06450 [Deltaproteobacteria bacterium]|nr:hypothetical protein [Deltaproteobacteria bacterium]
MSKVMNNNNQRTFIFKSSYKRGAWILIAIGLIGTLAGFLLNPTQAWANFLLNNVYFITLSVCGLFFVALQYVSGASWSEVLRRIPEAMAAYIPIGGILMLFLFFGMHSLFHWSHHEVVVNDPILSGKEPYLNVSFYFIRLLFIVLTWSLFSVWIRSNSIKQEKFRNLRFYQTNIGVSALFMIFFAVTVSMASFDWLMSLDPHWYSTIFAIYNFSGLFVSGLSVITIIAYFLSSKKILPEINENHFHDLGKYLLAFTTFWAYIWYSQFVLIWYGNIPEETIYFVQRLKGDWTWLFYTNLLINFVIPFFILLPRASKRSGAMIMRVSVLLLVGRWLDLYLMIAPSTLGKEASIGLIEVSMALGFAGLFILIVGRALSKRSVLPPDSPILQRSIHFHQ